MLTKKELIELLDTQFYEGFAARTAQFINEREKEREKIMGNNGVEMLCTFLADCIAGKTDLYRDTEYTRTFSRNAPGKIEFRAAYLFETFYFLHYSYNDKNSKNSKNNSNEYNNKKRKQGCGKEQTPAGAAIKNFMPEFYRLLPQVTNESTRRHFSKILYYDLKKNLSRNKCPADPGVLAATLAEWAIAPGVKAAVKIWSVESLFLLREEVEWLPGFLTDFIEEQSVNPSPAMKVRLRQWAAYGLQDKPLKESVRLT